MTPPPEMRDRLQDCLEAGVSLSPEVARSLRAIRVRRRIRYAGAAAPLVLLAVGALWLGRQGSEPPAIPERTLVTARGWESRWTLASLSDSGVADVPPPPGAIEPDQIPRLGDRSWPLDSR